MKWAKYEGCCGYTVIIREQYILHDFLLLLASRDDLYDEFMKIYLPPLIIIILIIPFVLSSSPIFEYKMTQDIMNRYALRVALKIPYLGIY